MRTGPVLNVTAHLHVLNQSTTLFIKVVTENREIKPPLLEL
ncbi:Protein of unknown function [Gryllus bimaculatus]|nr:Protein of unknown function [Gryllus bimaculatus]